MMRITASQFNKKIDKVGDELIEQHHSNQNVFQGGKAAALQKIQTIKEQ